MMSHEERVQLGGALSDRMVTAYGSDIVLGGIYGSTARSTDTPWSDLELLFVVRGGSAAKAQRLIYRGTPVGLVVIEQNTLEQQLASLDLAWGYWNWMLILAELKVLYGDPARVQLWLRLGESIPPEWFREALEAGLSSIVHEPFGRIMSCATRLNTRDIHSAVTEVLSEIHLALCLLNGRRPTHRYQGFVESFGFPRLPEGYADLVPALWSARDIDEIVPLAEQFVTNFWQLLAREGIRLPHNYQSVDELPVWG